MAGEVGKTGFEPATPWSQTRCATGLRYFPNIFLKSGAPPSGATSLSFRECKYSRFWPVYRIHFKSEVSLRDASADKPARISNYYYKSEASLRDASADEPAVTLGRRSR